MTRCALVAAVVVTLAALPRPGRAADASVVSAAEKEGKLVVYSTTDSAIVSALIKDFGAAYPKIPLEYNDMNSTELYNRYERLLSGGELEAAEEVFLFGGHHSTSTFSRAATASIAC